MSTPEQQQYLLHTLFELGRPMFPAPHWDFEGLTKSEFFLLNMVYDHSQQHPQTKGLYVSELLGMMRVSPPAVSRMLRGMEEKDYIERVVDRDDRRTTYIVLRPKGLALRKNAEKRALRFAGRILDQMGEEEVNQLLSLWRRMKQVVAQELAKEGT